MADITIDEGSTLRVDYLVTNNGGLTYDSSTSFDAPVELDGAGASEDSDQIVVSPGEQTSGALYWVDIQGTGVYTVTVQTDDGTVTREVEVV